MIALTKLEPLAPNEDISQQMALGYQLVFGQEIEADVIENQSDPVRGDRKCFVLLSALCCHLGRDTNVNTNRGIV